MSSLLTTSTLPAHAAKCSAVCPSLGSSMSREQPRRMMAYSTINNWKHNLIVAVDSRITVMQRIFTSTTWYLPKSAAAWRAVYISSECRAIISCPVMIDSDDDDNEHSFVDVM